MVTKTGKFENIGENFLIFDMNLGSYISFENEFSKSIPSFYKNLLKTWIICGGGRNKSTHNFREIGKQLTWGNKYIKLKGKCLAKVNWIKSGIICINDILDEYGRISEYKIIVKLRNKENWISELNILKKAIPKQWKDIIMSQDSIKTQVIPQKYIKIPNNQKQNLQMNMPVCSNHPHVCHIIVMYQFMFLDHASYVLFPIKY